MNLPRTWYAALGPLWFASIAAAQGSPPTPPTDAPPPEPLTEPRRFIAHAKWDLTLYGWVEADLIYDTTQGFSDLQGNTAIARPTTSAGGNDQMTFGMRDSRLGVKLDAPQVGVIKPSAVIEMDFLGNEATGAAAPTEQQFWQSPTQRIRFAYMKMETP